LVEMDDEHIERTEDEARGGSTPHIVRYVLGFSLALTIVAMAVILTSYVRM
jgi:heme/copper-type cytochrome/quinol oxidase subunit 4